MTLFTDAYMRHMGEMSEQVRKLFVFNVRKNETKLSRNDVYDIKMNRKIKKKKNEKIPGLFIM